MMPFLLLAGLALSGSARAGVVQGGSASLDAVYRPRRVAVLVGIQDYSDPALQGLRFPEKDARDLGEVLGDPARGAFDRVLVVEGSSGTTAAALRRTIAVATADLQRDDTFLLYLSGHGTLTLDPAEGSRLWFLPSDGQLEDPERTGLAIADIEAMVADLPARRRVLVLDTCHNGRTGSGGLSGRAALNQGTTRLLQNMRGDPPAPRTLREVSESEARLYAAQYHQPAMEDPELQNGVYTHFLLQALTDASRSADLDRDGLVDVAEAHDYARDQTMRHTGGIQVPRAEYRIVGREEIFLAGDPSRRSTAEKALIGAYDEILSKARLLIDGVPRGSAMGLTAIEPGRREVEVQSADGRTLARTKINVEAGATVSVEDLMRPHRSLVMVGLGAVLNQGPAEPFLHPAMGELELSWIDPVRTPDWLRLEGHLRAAGMSGSIEDQPEGPVQAGFNAAGLSLGGHHRGFSLGPQLELVQPWRIVQTDMQQSLQGTLTLAPGARFLWTLPIGQRDLALRLDSRFVPWTIKDDRTYMWQHGFMVGTTTRR